MGWVYLPCKAPLCQISPPPLLRHFYNILFLMPEFVCAGYGAVRALTISGHNVCSLDVRARNNGIPPCGIRRRKEETKGGGEFIIEIEIITIYQGMAWNIGSLEYWVCKEVLKVTFFRSCLFLEGSCTAFFSVDDHQELQSGGYRVPSPPLLVLWVQVGKVYDLHFLPSRRRDCGIVRRSHSWHTCPSSL